MSVVVRAQVLWTAALLLVVPAFAVGVSRKAAGDPLGFWASYGGLALFFLIAGAVRRHAERKSPRSFPRRMGLLALWFPAVILFAAAAFWAQ
jgi:hypothetical protein